MKPKFDAEALNLVKLSKKYSSESKARKLFEAMRWPGGKPICPHCQHDEAYKIKSRKETRCKARAGLYCCAACRKPFTATVGTVLEDSHIPISTWLKAMFILCNAKKSVSALQLKRMLGIAYKSAWFLAHRLRFAMGTDFSKVKQLENTVEADETFCPAFENPALKTCLALIVERDGQARTRVIPTVTAHNVGKMLSECVSKDATVNTDEHPSYKLALKGQDRHQRVNHSRYEYARHNPDGTVSHVNTAESFFSLLKRGIFGSWHCVSREHLAKYAYEFEFRWNTRKVSDGERMVEFVPMIIGKRLMYRQPKN